MNRGCLTCRQYFVIAVATSECVMKYKLNNSNNSSHKEKTEQKLSLNISNYLYLSKTKLNTKSSTKKLNKN